jgi:hypothetical protein
LPEDIREPLVQHQNRASLLEVQQAAFLVSPQVVLLHARGRLLVGSHELFLCLNLIRVESGNHSQVVLDLGRRPEARFLGVGGGEYLRDAEVLCSGFSGDGLDMQNTFLVVLMSDPRLSCRLRGMT